MTPDANYFLKYDYAETKDLAKAFLTLISAILVFSMTFSDKIVEFPKAGRAARARLFASWILFAIAIILCGIAICINYQAEIMAVYETEGGINILIPLTGIVYHFDQGAYLLVGMWAGGFMFFSGVCFVAGLITLLSSAVKSASARTAATATGEDAIAAPAHKTNGTAGKQ